MLFFAIFPTENKATDEMYKNAQKKLDIFIKFYW